jgi:pimeloyl-ACP methyl ester carboxylesterase
MTKINLPAQIEEKKIQAGDLNMNVLFAGDKKGTPVIFLHGNFSSAFWWVDVLLTIPEGYYAIAPDLRGYGWTEDKLIDATQGMKDWCEDIVNLMDALKIEKAHFVGWSLAGGILYRFIADHPEKILSVTLEAPVSPFGFGGTKGVEGQATQPDFAGSGGGVVNPVFVKLISEGDRSADDPNSPRNVINTYYYKAPYTSQREEDFLTAALMEKTGPERYNGDYVPSENWPNVAPGKWGPINAGSIKYIKDDVPAMLAVENKPPILWIRGAGDMIVSDQSFFDMGALGALGYLPGYPGTDVYPPQPMVSQTRYVMEKYGNYQEVVIQEAGHAAHVQALDEFNQSFHKFIKENN